MTTNTPQNIKDDITAYGERHGTQLIVNNKNDNYKCYFCEKPITSNEWTGVTIGRYEDERNIEYLACGEKCCGAPDEISQPCTKCGDKLLVGYFKGAAPAIDCYDCTIIHYSNDSDEEFGEYEEHEEDY
jgi:hypothetical protein